MQCSEQSGPKWFFKMSAGIINAAVPTHQLPESATSEKFFASTEKKLQENFCPTKSFSRNPSYITTSVNVILFDNTIFIHWWDSISRPIAPVFSVSGGDDSTGPRRQDVRVHEIVIFVFARNVYLFLFFIMSAESEQL
jgi:hypothetical protein